jgi:nucleoside-diphosphate-sugar epimerase
MKGMDNVVDAAAKAGIKRIVYTSALHALFGGE